LGRKKKRRGVEEEGEGEGRKRMDRCVI